MLTHVSKHKHIAPVAVMCSYKVKVFALWVYVSN